MRIALFDGLLEAHVPASLARALRARGHEVHQTGKIGHGFTFETDPSRLEMINGHIDQVLGFDPDVVLVFRPASLPPTLLRRLRRGGAQLLAWLSDDPVLWDLSYRPVVDLYDVVLHCGAERVLRFYDDHFQRPLGVNFPFWTDNIAFPYVYSSHAPESTAMFLGNVQDGIRRQRYYAMADLETDVRIHGSIGIDFRNLGAGYLDSDREVVEAAARARVAINIPQFFRDHLGEPTWFKGLDELGTFQYPSRVIQYAAMGLPIVSVTPTPEDYDAFPELRTVREVDQIDRAIAQLISERSLMQVSRQTHRRFLRHFSAASRVLALEFLAADDSWRSLDTRDRARWFANFDGSRAQPPLDVVPTSGDSPRDRVEVATTAEAPQAPLRIALVGDGWRRAASPLNVARRALEGLGHHVIPADPHQNPDWFAKDPYNEYRNYVSVDRLLEMPNGPPDVLLLVGTFYGMSGTGREALIRAGVPLIVHAITNSSLNVANSKLIDRADAVSVTHPDLHTALHARGFTFARLSPGLVDSRALQALNDAPVVSPRIRVIGEQLRHISGHQHLYGDLVAAGAVFDLVEGRGCAPETLEDLVEYVGSAVNVVPADASLAGGQPGEYFSVALAASGLVVTPRAVGSAIGGIPGTTHITARDRYELQRKLNRLREDDGAGLRGYVTRAREHVRDHLVAETFIRELLTEALLSTANRANSQDSLCLTGAQARQGDSIQLVQNIHVDSYRGSTFRIKLQRMSNLRFSAAKLIEVQVCLDEHVIAICPLSELPELTKLSIAVPAGPTIRTAAIQLVTTDDLPFANWRAATEIIATLEEHRLDATSPQTRVLSSSASFQLTGRGGPVTTPRSGPRAHEAAPQSPHLEVTSVASTVPRIGAYS